MTAALETDTGRSNLTLPHPSDPSRSVVWGGQAFDLDGKAVRVLYDVAQSGWTTSSPICMKWW